MELAARNHVSVEQEMRGKSFDWDGVRVDFLWPADLQTDPPAPPKNNDSLVVRLQFRERSILLTGDAEKQAEASMIANDQREPLQAEVLKVGHHGSKNSSSPDFLDAVAPQIAIISAGEVNPYGHPSPELLERLDERHLRVLRTDRDGAVDVQTDGRAWRVQCFVACAESAATGGSEAAQTPDHRQRQQQ